MMVKCQRASHSAQTAPFYQVSVVVLLARMLLTDSNSCGRARWSTAIGLLLQHEHCFDELRTMLMHLLVRCVSKQPV